MAVAREFSDDGFGLVTARVIAEHHGMLPSEPPGDATAEAATATEDRDRAHSPFRYHVLLTMHAAIFPRRRMARHDARRR